MHSTYIGLLPLSSFRVGLHYDVIVPRFSGIFILVWYFWIKEDRSYPLISNKHLSLLFALLCDREQPVRLNADLFSMTDSDRSNSTKSCLQQRLRFGSYLQKYETSWAGLCCNLFVMDVVNYWHIHSYPWDIRYRIGQQYFLVSIFSGSYSWPLMCWNLLCSQCVIQA